MPYDSTGINNPAGLLFKLTVNDCDTGNENGNSAPSADAGPDQTIIFPSDSATLDGSNSTDADGTIASYVWNFVSGPSTIHPDDTVTSNISGLIEGTYVFELIVTDNDGASDSDTIQITVTAGGTGGGELPECSDGVDNDDSEDSLVDENDPGCHTNNDLEAPYIESDNSESNDSSENTPTGSSSGGRRSSGSRSSGNVPAVPTVLGESSCGEYLTSYIKIGKQNDTANVSRLQTFLNKHLGLNLRIDGIFGKNSFAAVKQFQLKHATEVLVPWVGVTLPNATEGTGWVYKTTKRWINMIECPELNLPMPTLTIEPQESLISKDTSFKSLSMNRGIFACSLH